ncbi:hypothetical protein DQ353_18385 [Arthrobacter sp. AQ5-05]|nr:hypothetical protein DQ353_18385 [Arthrobacter sp. AQ5-05]
MDTPGSPGGACHRRILDMRSIANGIVVDSARCCFTAEGCSSRLLIPIWFHHYLEQNAESSQQNARI